MMLSKFESGFLDDNDVTNGQLLRDIEEISKALYLNYKPNQSSLLSSKLRLKSAKELQNSDVKLNSNPGFDEQKPSSIWGWKPFKALSHIKQRKFTCYFFCHVHCIEKLTSDFDGVSMSVHWRRKNRVLKTLPSRVSNGMADFEETLMSKSVVYCIKNGYGNFVKYEPKHFLLYASLDERGGLDIGKHWVDLTRLLPLTIEDLEEDKCSGKWSTSFKLAGKAKGATLQVSFAYLVTKDGFAELGSDMKLPIVYNVDQTGVSRLSFVGGEGNSRLRRVGSVPSSLTDTSVMSPQFSDVKYDRFNNMLDYSTSLNLLYEKLEEGKVGSQAKLDRVLEHLESLDIARDSFSSSTKDVCRGEFDDTEFNVIEKGIELEQTLEEKIQTDVSVVEQDVPIVEVIDVAEIFKDEGISSDEEAESNGRNEVMVSDANDTLEDKHHVPYSKISSMEKEYTELDQSQDDVPNEIKLDDKRSKMVESLSLDVVAESVSDDFINLLQGAHSLESPRERLLREFEEDMSSSSSFILGVDFQEDDLDTYYGAPSVSSSDYDIESIDLLPTFDTFREKSVKPSSKCKIKAQYLESLETQSLMQRWGLNEEAFESASHYSKGGFGSPVFVTPEEPVGLPPLSQGLAPVLPLKDGGLLRSMSPLLFQNVKSCGRLVLQASKPVVLPNELGSDILEILQCMGSIGIKRLCDRVHALMPLEELSGKITQHLSWEALCKADVLQRPASSDQASDVKRSLSVSDCSDLSTTLCDISHDYLYIKDIALLAVESIEALLIEGLKIHSCMSDHNAPSSIRVKPVSEVTSNSAGSTDFSVSRGAAKNVDELLGFSLSLDEWLRLSAKPRYPSNQKNSEEEGTLNKSEQCGLLKDGIAVALMTQLRDPLRNYESVGAPMLVLIQAERFWDQMDSIKDGQDGIPRFIVHQVHVTGINSGYGVPESWATRRQHQAGSRWLLASGLTNNRYTQLSKSMSLSLKTRVLRNSWTRNFLWSISQSVKFSTQHSLIRNPDIIFS